ncbi:MAG: hypothetical protein RL095_1576 [Verrucomicrobiota bacterium]|jgi:hypothetical protein
MKPIFSILAAACALSSLSCRSLNAAAKSEAPPVIAARTDLPAEAPTLLIFRKGSENFAECTSALAAAASDCRLVDAVMPENMQYEQFAAKIREVKPRLLLLMDNQAVSYARRFNQEPDDYARKLRSVAAMGLNLPKILAGNKLISAVEYEVPAYTILTQWRHLSGIKVEKALVFYRGSQHREMIHEASEQLAKEGITLRAIDCEVDGQGRDQVIATVKKLLPLEVGKGDAQAVWVLADSVLLCKETFSGTWVKTARGSKVAFVSGIAEFSGKKAGFCAFSASPDHKALGSQVANLALDVMENDDEAKVDHILAVVKTLDEARLKSLGITPHAAR